LYISLILVLTVFYQLKKNKINGIAFLKAILISGILYLLCVRFADEKVAFSAKNIIYIYITLWRGNDSTQKKTNVKSMFLSKKNGFSRGMGFL